MKLIVSFALALAVLGSTAWSQSKPQSAAKTPAPVKKVPSKFEFRKGDVVLLVGDALIEQERLHGFLEYRLTVQNPGKRLRFYNIGWSGDSPAGIVRDGLSTLQAGHEPPGEGWRQLQSQVRQIAPTVAIVGYGMASSFDGKSGLEQFKKDYKRLIEYLKSFRKDGPPMRLVLLSPLRHEKMSGKLPDPAPHNAQLELYSNVVKELASGEGARFVNLYRLLGRHGGGASMPSMTSDGIHLSEFGYWRFAAAVEYVLHLERTDWRLGIMPDGSVRQGSFGLNAKNLKRERGRIKFDGILRGLPPFLPIGKKSDSLKNIGSVGRIQVLGLEQGSYTMAIDGEELFTRTATEWSRGPFVDSGPDVEQAEKLRRAIVEKNELFFHRSRPQNQAYLWGFRKHEQGRNYKEIPMFDQLVATREKEIHRLNTITQRQYQILPAAEWQKIKPDLKNQEIRENSKAKKTFTPQPKPEFDVADGFKINLFAQNPLLAKPIQMNFDPKGRLWVACSSVYPQIQPGQKAEDKIIVLEDTDSDGRADTSSVFAEGLLIPTAIEPGNGGVYIGQSTELLHFKDIDNDGRADERRVVLSGFGTEDTHHILHTLRWGFDGRLYFNQSIYIRSHLETPHGVVRLKSGGVMRLHPETMKAEVFLKGFCNPWGHHFDEFGQSFVTDGAGFQGVSYAVPGAMYFTYARAPRILDSVSPGRYPKFCGLEMVRGSHFPEDWQGDAITGDFRAHRVVRFKVIEKDSAYVTQEMPDLVRSRSVTFRPIDVKFGPDGAMYIADWANPIIQHGEVDFRDSRRDHVHGRIWRVTAKGRPLVKKTDFTQLSNKVLFNRLMSRNEHERRQIRRVVVERGEKQVLPDIESWSAAAENDPERLEVLWLFQALDHVEPELLQRLLNSRDGRIRTAAVQVLAAWMDRVENATDLLAARIRDGHPRVRMAAVRALALQPSSRNAALALEVLDRSMDPYLDYATWLSINDLLEPWLAAVKDGEWKPDGNEKQLEFALKAIPANRAREVLGVLLPGGGIPESGSWIELIGRAGTQTELNQLHARLAANEYSRDGTVRSLAALNHAARLRNLNPAVPLGSVTPFLLHDDDSVKLEALRLAGAWKQIGPGYERLAYMVRHPKTSAALRVAAFDAIREIGGERAFSTLLPLTGKKVKKSIRQPAVLALARLDIKRAAPTAVALLDALLDEQELLEVWRALLGIKGAGKVLAEALPQSRFSRTAARIGVRVSRESGRNLPELALALPRSAGLKDEHITLSKGEIRNLARAVENQADPVRGELVYRRLELGCITCHAIGGAGGKVGPDMTSIGASAPLDYLIESVFYPNRKIKEGYHSVVLELEDGQMQFGMLERETGDAVVLRDVANRITQIPMGKIKKRTQGMSLMPSGLIDALKPQEQIDLFKFLSQLGKAGPFDASKANIARVWNLQPATHQMEQFVSNKSALPQLSPAKWGRVLSMVDGRLTSDLIRTGPSAGPWVGVVGVYVATKFNLAKAGSVILNLEGANGAPAWVDGKLLEGREGVPMQVSLGEGEHTLTVRLDPKALPKHLRAESSDVTFLTQ